MESITVVVSFSHVLLYICYWSPLPKLDASGVWPPLLRLPTQGTSFYAIGNLLLSKFSVQVKKGQMNGGNELN